MILNVRTNIFILGGGGRGGRVGYGMVCSFTKIFSTVFSLSAAYGYGPVNLNILGKSSVWFVKNFGPRWSSLPLHNIVEDSRFVFCCTR
jgi:hypothetical protein